MRPRLPVARPVTSLSAMRTHAAPTETSAVRRAGDIAVTLTPARRPEHGELVRPLQAAAAEAELGCRAPPGGAGWAPPARRLELAAAKQHALQVRRRDRVAERGDVDRPQLGDREVRRRQREADVRVG